MDKKTLNMEIPEKLKNALDDLSKQTGRNKNIIVGVSLYQFLETKNGQQEELIKKYINTYCQ
jgi:predicted DNA-binding protein